MIKQLQQSLRLHHKIDELTSDRAFLLDALIEQTDLRTDERGYRDEED